MTFSEFARLYGRDERFKAVDKKREREVMFADYLTELKKSTREREGQQRQAVKSRADKVRGLVLDNCATPFLSLFLLLHPTSLAS